LKVPSLTPKYRETERLWLSGYRQKSGGVTPFDYFQRKASVIGSLAGFAISRLGFSGVDLASAWAFTHTDRRPEFVHVPK